MKKIYLVILSAVYLLLPLALKAQQKISVIDQRNNEDIKPDAAVEVKINAALLRKKYGGNAESEKALYKLLYQQKLEEEQVLLTFGKTQDLEKRLTNVINKKDSLVEVWIQRTEARNSAAKNILKGSDNSKFAAAVKLKKDLGLTTTQVDSLIRHTYVLQDLLTQNSDFKPKDYERKILPKILSEEQYTTLLVYLAKDRAFKYAQADWKELKERGIPTERDSVKVIREIMNYDIGKSVIKERYGNEIPKTSVSLQKTQSSEPEELKILRRARRYNNPIPADKTAKTIFAW